MLGNLRELLGLITSGAAGAGKNAAKKVIPAPVSAGINAARGMGGAGKMIPKNRMPQLGQKLPMMAYKQRMPQEDDGMVDTNSGRMPLSNVGQGQSWRNTENGYGQGLMVQQNYGMQGNGRVEEDYVSARNHLQPTDYNNHQQPMNGQFLQGQTNARDDYLRRILGY